MSVWCVCKLINQSDPEAQCRFTRTQRFIVVTHAVLYSGCLVCWCHLYPSCPAVSLCQTTQLAADSHVELSVVCMLICWSCGSSVMIFICLKIAVVTENKRWNHSAVRQNKRLPASLRTTEMHPYQQRTGSFLMTNQQPFSWQLFQLSRGNTETKSDKE